ncbi:hypothetical protein EON83_29520 [bacterium]|nr:MAG: hypothetical protein EON83_29520 [bacterium]
MPPSLQLLASFEDSATFSTLTVYNSDMAWPANRWTNRHVEQGFSWREGCVAFGTLGSMGIQIEVWLTDRIELLPQTQRAIRVPFTVNQSGAVGVGGSCEDNLVSIPTGTYDLLFENGMDYTHNESPEREEAGLLDMWCRLCFIPSTNPQAEVLRELEDVKGGEGQLLTPTYPLLMEAEPA